MKRLFFSLLVLGTLNAAGQVCKPQEQLPTVELYNTPRGWKVDSIRLKYGGAGGAKIQCDQNMQLTVEGEPIPIALLDVPLPTTKVFTYACTSKDGKRCHTWQVVPLAKPSNSGGWMAVVTYTHKRRR